MKNNIYKVQFYVFAIVALVIMLWVTGDYGICWDELIHKQNGEKALDFFTSFGGKKEVYGSSRLINIPEIAP